MQVALGNAKKGDKISVQIIRNKKKRTLKATLDSQGPTTMPWGSSGDSPFQFDFGAMDMDFGNAFPFGHGPPAMQEQLRKLEERLKRLEGKSPKSRKKS